MLIWILAFFSQIFIYLGNALFSTLNKERSFQYMEAFYLTKPIVGVSIAVALFYLSKAERIPFRNFAIVIFLLAIIFSLIIGYQRDYSLNQALVTLTSGFFVGLGEVLVCYVLTQDPMKLTVLLPLAPIMLTIFRWRLDPKNQAPGFYDGVAVFFVVIAMSVLVYGRTQSNTTATIKENLN